MIKYSFELHRCQFDRKGFDKLPSEIETVCKNAVIFYKLDGFFVLCDIDAFTEFRDMMFDHDDRGLIALRRQLFNRVLHFEGVGNFELILRDLIERYQKCFLNLEEIEVEMRPYNMVFCGKELKNQFIEIKLLSATEMKT